MPERKTSALAVFGLAAAVMHGSAPGEEGQEAAELRRRAAWVLRHAVVYFRTQVSTEGGYVWRYSEDLARREGEGVCEDTVIWVQPPGTPAVGMAYLRAYEATGERLYLDAARDAAIALVRGQLRSGGWTHHIELDPEKRRRYAYRTEAGGKKQRNWSSLDDDTTQASLRLLMRVDRALEFADKTIHEAAEFGAEALLAAQHPNGGFSQGFDGPAERRGDPGRKADYPEDWPRSVPPGNDYWRFYTINDGLMEDVVEALLDAEEIYGDERFREAAERAGRFLVLSQMPEPQPGWAQQYDFDMHPTWARKFEPPAITGGESQGVIRTLLTLCRATGKKEYLEPIPKALGYFRRSLLPDGRLARFYELRTNRPLYFTMDYVLTYSDERTPTHYSFKVESGLDRMQREFERLAAMRPEDLALEKPKRTRVGAASIKQAREVVESLDHRGRWVEEGGLRFDKEYGGRVIDCRTFIRNVEILSRFLAAERR